MKHMGKVFFAIKLIQRNQMADKVFCAYLDYFTPLGLLIGHKCRCGQPVVKSFRLSLSRNTTRTLFFRSEFTRRDFQSMSGNKHGECGLKFGWTPGILFLSIDSIHMTAIFTLASRSGWEVLQASKSYNIGNLINSYNSPLSQ